MAICKKCAAALENPGKLKDHDELEPVGKVHGLGTSQGNEFECRACHTILRPTDDGVVAKPRR
jgi:hypothetical protein